MVSMKFNYIFDKGFKGPILTLYKTLQSSFIKGIIQRDTMRDSNWKLAWNHI